jgi:hypothetical protein
MTNVQPVTAKIFQFPKRGRFAEPSEGEQQGAFAQWGAKVVVSDAWYHDAAIEAERARKN